MNRYTIYCTEDQTKKALKLGAPIRTIKKPQCNVGLIERITTEQMIGWLEEQGVVIIFMGTMKEDLSGYTWIAHICHFEDTSIWVDIKSLSHKEATLKAIDAALDYLINKQKK